MNSNFLRRGLQDGSTAGANSPFFQTLTVAINNLSPAGENPHHSLPGLSPKVQSQDICGGVHAERLAETERQLVRLEPDGQEDAVRRSSQMVGNQSGPQIVPSQVKKPSQSVGRSSEEDVA